MTIKHLQLNTSTLRSPHGIMEFIKEQQIDVSCLQEIVYEQDSINPLKELAENNSMHYFEGIHFYLPDTKKVVASAIISKFKIEDYEVLYFNTENFKPKLITQNSFIGGELLNDNFATESMSSRGLKHSVKSRALPIVTVLVGTAKLRLYSVHFTVSSRATETEQMYSFSQLINSHLHFSKQMPTILSGDFNITKDTYSIRHIEQEVTLHTNSLSNTLAKTHRALEHDFPNGLAVDHVFSRSIKHKKTLVHHVEFSDHQALVSEFEL